jgi:hypothetical protein
MTRDSRLVRHAFQLAAVVLVGTTAGIPNSSQAASWTAINAGLPAIGVGVNSLVVDPDFADHTWTELALRAQTGERSIASNSGAAAKAT